MGYGVDSQRKSVADIFHGEGIKKETQEFGIFLRSLTKLKDWLLENGVMRAAMKSTCVYWKLVFHVLETAPIKAWIVNACHIKYVLSH